MILFLFLTALRPRFFLAGFFLYCNTIYHILYIIRSNRIHYCDVNTAGGRWAHKIVILAAASAYEFYFIIYA